MKKLITAISLNLIFTCLAVGQAAKTSKEVDGLAGPVQSAVTESVELSNENGEWVEGERTVVSLITYDKDGHDGRFNNALQNQSPVGSIGRVRRDEQGREIEHVTDLPDGVTIKRTTKYDEKGMIAEQADYKGDGSLLTRTAYTYDARGHTTSLASYDSSNVLTRKLTWTFDEKGNRTEWTESTRRGSELLLFSKIVSVYDDKGNVMEETQYGNPEGTVTKQTFSYDFDSLGNWIRRDREWRRTELESGQSYVVSRAREYRTISYYPQ